MLVARPRPTSGRTHDRASGRGGVPKLRRGTDSGGLGPDKPARPQRRRHLREATSFVQSARSAASTILRRRLGGRLGKRACTCRSWRENRERSWVGHVPRRPVREDKRTQKAQHPRGWAWRPGTPAPSSRSRPAARPRGRPGGRTWSCQASRNSRPATSRSLGWKRRTSMVERPRPSTSQRRAAAVYTVICEKP